MILAVIVYPFQPFLQRILVNTAASLNFAVWLPEEPVNPQSPPYKIGSMMLLNTNEHAIE